MRLERSKCALVTYSLEPQLGEEPPVLAGLELFL